MAMIVSQDWGVTDSNRCKAANRVAHANSGLTAAARVRTLKVSICQARLTRAECGCSLPRGDPSGTHRCDHRPQAAGQLPDQQAMHLERAEGIEPPSAAT
jgi:hypothetical protein